MQEFPDHKRYWIVPPKVSFFVRDINGKDQRIKLVRSSLICRLFSKGESLIIGHTIYALDLIVTRKVFNRAVERIKIKDRMGTWAYIWQCLTKKET